MDVNTSTLSLPNEIISEINNHIELPADIVRFSLACKDFHECSDEWKIKWFARMRNIVNEINKIEYTICNRFAGICEDYDKLDPKSCRSRDGIITYSYFVPRTYVKCGKDIYDNILRILQKFPLNKINKHREQRLLQISYGFNDQLRLDMEARKQVCISLQYCDIKYHRPIFNKPTFRTMMSSLYH